MGSCADSGVHHMSVVMLLTLSLLALLQALTFELLSILLVNQEDMDYISMYTETLVGAIIQPPCRIPCPPSIWPY